MRLLRMPSGVHQCLIFSTAMLINVAVERIIEILGHNGMDVWWPDNKIPTCYRGVHMQEIQYVVNQFDFHLVPYQVMPRSAPISGEPRNVWSPEEAMLRIQGPLQEEGLIITDTHACAWDGKSVYDPNGRIISIGDISIKEFWKLIRI